jgi:hypothetical protein
MLFAESWTARGKWRFLNQLRASSRTFLIMSTRQNKVAAQADQLVSSAVPERPQSGAVLCIAGRTPIGQAACAILAQLVEREHVVARVLGSDALSIRGVSRLNPESVEALCASSTSVARAWLWSDMLYAG